jgi:hypothetical protein
VFFTGARALSPVVSTGARVAVVVLSPVLSPVVSTGVCAGAFIIISSGAGGGGGGRGEDRNR